MAEKRTGLPRWLWQGNRMIVALQRRGPAIGTMRLLSVPGRRSGRLRTTPVSPLEVDGRRYIVAGLEEADTRSRTRGRQGGASWPADARRSGWGWSSFPSGSAPPCCESFRTECQAASGSSGSSTGSPGTPRNSRVPTWHKGAMIVIGDAAHATAPSSGQGASMAVEDAVVLARRLRDLPETGRAFAAYERLRRQRVERIVAHGARTSNSKAAGPLGRVLRDLMLPVVLKHAAGGSLAWMHDYHIAWDERVAA